MIDGARADAGSTQDLDRCDAYAVLVVDPRTGEVDVHGPLDGPEAVVEAGRRRGEHDDAGLGDVLVEVVRMHHPR